MMVLSVSRVFNAVRTNEREQGLSTSGSGQDHVRVLRRCSDRGDPALVAGERAEVAQRFHVVRCVEGEGGGVAFLLLVGVRYVPALPRARDSHRDCVTEVLYSCRFRRLYFFALDPCRPPRARP